MSLLSHGAQAFHGRKEGSEENVERPMLQLLAVDVPITFELCLNGSKSGSKGLQFLEIFSPSLVANLKLPLCQTGRTRCFWVTQMRVSSTDGSQVDELLPCSRCAEAGRSKRLSNYFPRSEDGMARFVVGLVGQKND